MVEQCLDKALVAGSNPAVPTKTKKEGIYMTFNEIKKQQLLGFIKWKMKKQNQKELKEIMPKLKKMSLEELIDWAIRNDIIDSYWASS